MAGGWPSTHSRPANPRFDRNVLESIRSEFWLDTHRTGGLPRLVILKSNDRIDSAVYVRRKQLALAKIGFESRIHEFGKPPRYDEVLRLILDLNGNANVHGILVQQPFETSDRPSQAMQLGSIICPTKDVDGYACLRRDELGCRLHPLNVGLLAMKGEGPQMVPCTPVGIMRLLSHHDVCVKGKSVAIIGRSNIVGLPLFHLMNRHNATVTLCHSQTADIPLYTRSADIVVAAVGIPRFVKGHFLKPGAVVVDVGINHDPFASSLIVGDVDADSVSAVASAITPVPGGVGPMTIAMLVSNLWSAFKTRR